MLPGAADRRGAARRCSSSSASAVIVGHNIRFDTRFLDAALARRGCPPLEQPARRHARPRRAGSCATRCPTSSSARSRATSGSPTEPCHRALADARRDRRGAPRAARAGRHVRRARPRRPARAPDDPRAPVGEQARGSPRGSPAGPASTCSATAAGEVLYVGQGHEPPRPGRARTSAATTAARSRSSLRETEAIDWIECADELEASVRELRLIQELEPRFNRAGQGLAVVRVPEAHARRARSRASPWSARRSDDGAATSVRSPSTAPRTACARRSRRRCRSGAAPRASAARPTASTRRARRRSSASRAARAAARLDEADYAARVETVRAGSPATRDCCSSRSTRGCTSSPTPSGSRTAATARPARRADARAAPTAAARAGCARSGRCAVADGVGRRRARSTAACTLDRRARRTAQPPTPASAARRPHRLDELLVVARWLDREVGAGRARLLEPSGPHALARATGRSRLASRRRGRRCRASGSGAAARRRGRGSGGRRGSRRATGASGAGGAAPARAAVAGSPGADRLRRLRGRAASPRLRRAAAASAAAAPAATRPRRRRCRPASPPSTNERHRARA